MNVSAYPSLARRIPLGFTATIKPDNVERALAAHHIPLSSWGTKGAKSLADLKNDLVREKVELRNVQGKLILHIQVAVVFVFIKEPQPQLLYEAYREFAGGHRQTRTLDGSLGETLHKEELPEKAAHRGLLEELGFKNATGYVLETPLAGNEEIMPARMSDTYPGLLSVYHRHKFYCTISSQLYRPAYTEWNPGLRRKTVFLWRDI